MDYEFAETEAAAHLGADQPYLSRIGDLANIAEENATRLADFIDRCRGGGNMEPKSGPTPVPSGHFGQLNRLGDALSKLDKLTRELSRIG